MAEGGKLLKKMARKRAQFLASEPQIGVKFLDYIPSAAGDLSSSYHLFIGNGGTRNGLSSEVLSSLLECIDIDNKRVLVYYLWYRPSVHARGQRL